MYCDAYSSDYMDPFYGQQVYTCSKVTNSTSGGGGGEPPAKEEEEKLKTQFRYWKATQKVEVRQTWECRDLGEGPMSL